MKRDNKKVIYWLFTGCVLIFIMVVVGGITRLTHSGLSIPDYKLISGTIPPINDQQWEEAFDLYKQYPEYQLATEEMTLQKFKYIFYINRVRHICRVVNLLLFSCFCYNNIANIRTGCN